MCGLAELLHNMGVQVKGSDLSENQQTIRLREMGIQIHIGHKDTNLDDVDVAVYSSAVKSDNVEFKAAKKNGIPLIARAEALAEIMRMKRGLAVGGTHGKTTTTSMAAAIFLHANMDPTIVIGGRLDLIKSTAKLGSGEWLVAEADESDGSFNRLSPEMVIITNIDDDHIDHYQNFQNLQNAFFEFATRVPFYGIAIVCGDDPKVKDLFANYPKRVLFYGFEDSNDFVLKGGKGSYTLYEGDDKLGSFDLKVAGAHNALNATAAIISSKHAGIPWDKCFRGIESYNGVDRRMQKKFDVNGILFYDDYGHHPTEIEAVLSAFREQYPKRRLVALFQPHRFSRTKACWDDFTKCFKEADEVFMTDIYAAGEKPIAGVTTPDLLAALKNPNNHYIESRDQIKTVMLESLKSGDVFVTLGAGDVWKFGEEIAGTMR